MLVEELISKYNIKLSDQAKKFAQEGFGRMKNSKDLLHDHNHVQDILTNLDDFLQYETSINIDDINFPRSLFNLLSYSAFDKDNMNKCFP